MTYFVEFSARVWKFCKTFEWELTYSNIEDGTHQLQTTSGYISIILSQGNKVREVFHFENDRNLSFQSNFENFLNFGSWLYPKLDLKRQNDDKGAFTNYVDKILAFFDHLPPSVDMKGLKFGVNISILAVIFQTKTK